MANAIHLDVSKWVRKTPALDSCDLWPAIHSAITTFQSSVSFYKLASQANFLARGADFTDLVTIPTARKLTRMENARFMAPLTEAEVLVPTTVISSGRRQYLCH
ncbi:unnamed protein product [Peronospora belbahrii]|nr:unnamed protein product [Peronospora belbahrii]